MALGYLSYDNMSVTFEYYYFEKTVPERNLCPGTVNVHGLIPCTDNTTTDGFDFVYPGA